MTAILLTIIPTVPATCADTVCLAVSADGEVVGSSAAESHVVTSLQLA